MSRTAGAVLAACLLLACTGSEDRVVIAVGTTLADSGVADDLAREYESSHPGVEVSVVPEATLRVLELGRRGAAGVLITHAPSAEGEFVALTASEAFTRIAEDRLPVLGRRDGSGTAEAEVSIWEAAGIEPYGEPWYQSTGLGMGETILVADQRSAYVLAEFGVFLEMAPRISLRAADLASDPLLANDYFVILPVGASAEARAVFDWLVSAEGRDALAASNENRFGLQVYAAVTAP
jgi:tungstate transport system substrate-binding protein